MQCFWCAYALRKGKNCQYSSHLYRSTPPICIAIRLPFVSQYFWESLGGCGHRDASQYIIDILSLGCTGRGWSGGRGGTRTGTHTHTQERNKKHAFGKPCFCLRDTRHSLDFRHFGGGGSGERGPWPLFVWVEHRLVIFAVFVKTPTLFLAGDKSTVFQEHGFSDPDFKKCPTCKTETSPESQSCRDLWPKLSAGLSIASHCKAYLPTKWPPQPVECHTISASPP